MNEIDRVTALADSDRRCHDCDTPYSGRFCPKCGQKDQPLQQPVHHFVRDATVELFGVDGRLWPSLRLLITKPGSLTEAYIRGQRSRYVRPLRLYLSATLLFFFLLSIVDPATRLELQLQGAVQSDSTSTAISRFDVINQRMRDDSTRLTSRLDAVDEALDRADSSSTDVLHRARGRLESTRRDIDLRRQRFLWQQEILATYPPDSLIRPQDLANASRVVYPGQGIEDGEIEITTGLPSWAIRNAALRRLRTAKTNDEQLAAGLEFLRGIIGRLPAAMFLMLPVFALLLKPLYASHRVLWLTAPMRNVVARLRGVPSKGRPPTKNYYTDHLVFGLHTHAFAFLAFAVLTVVNVTISSSKGLQVISLIVSAWVGIYFLLAQRRVYGEGWIRTILKSMILATVYLFLVLALGFTLAFVLAAALG